LYLPFLGKIATDIGDVPKSIATYLVGQDESRVNTHRCGFKASELELNRSFSFGMRSLVVDVHDTTLPKGSGIVSIAVLIGPPMTLNAEVPAGEG
jgi:hypothetical protein